MPPQIPPAPLAATAGPAALDLAARCVALEHENARLRGDLRTIGRRLTHDLRTPLNCISTACDALGDPTTDRESATLFTQSIAEAVNEAATLVDRLSVVLMATGNPTEPRLFTMGEIVWGALQRLETRITKAGATIAQPPTWPAAKGVPAWTDLIWTNLVGNSLTHAGAKPRLELGWEKIGEEIRFWLRDSGQGVAERKRGLLFHPLDRLHELNAPRSYGLSIVHRLVELQGGRCGYAAEPAPGGTFFFTLPAPSDSALPAK